MTTRRKPPKFLWRLMRLPRIWYKIGLGSVVGRIFLLLTTTGRKTGLPRETPLQYEEVNGAIYVASARGMDADWVRNIAANPLVTVQIRARRFEGTAEIVTSPARIADFLQLRLERRPRMMGAMLRAEGLLPDPTRADLEALAARIVVVAIRSVVPE
jgi:deazaflavin-dependent oxidoreductase (nitroreductase family)